jgi:HlyD family secretion protein
MATHPVTSRPKRKWLWIGLTSLALGLLAMGLGLSEQITGKGTTKPISTSRPLDRVGAWGRLAPMGEVLALTVPTDSTSGRIAKLLVKEGAALEPGELIATLDTYDRRSAAVTQARAHVEVKRARLAVTRSGAKPAERLAQRAIVERYEIEHDHTVKELARMKQLQAKQAASQEQVAQRELALNVARQNWEQAQEALVALETVRPEDIALAEREVAEAEASLAMSEADLALAEVRAPTAGQVLRINTRPGERVSTSGICEFGQTSQMYAVAEVYESDIGRVAIGQAATIRVPTLDSTLLGTVETVGQLVKRKVIFSNDPVADTDARVVEVWIKLAPEDSTRVRSLSNARVEIAINTTP